MKKSARRRSQKIFAVLFAFTFLLFFRSFFLFFCWINPAFSSVAFHKQTSHLQSKLSDWVLFEMLHCPQHVKVGLSPSKKICVICLIESPLKMMKNAFYFILKALFVLKLF